MLKKLIGAGVVLLMTGCVSVQNIPLTPDAAKNVQGREISLGQREKPSFAAMTAGKAAFAMLGAAAMISAGNEIVAQNDVEDPANYIGEHLRADLVKRYQSRVSNKMVQIATDDVAEVSKANQGTDLLLDVRTINWSFAYFPTNWSHYRVIYSARFRLIDAKQGTVVAEGFCSRVPDETPSAPTYDELLANKAERLKKELHEAADHCLGEFRSKTLML